MAEINDFLGSKQIAHMPTNVAILSGYSNYPKGASWTAKVTYLLQNTDKPLRNPEVLERICQLEGIGDDEKERERVRRSISPILSKNEKGLYTVTEVNGKNAYSIKK